MKLIALVLSSLVLLLAGAALAAAGVATTASSADAPAAELPEQASDAAQAALERAREHKEARGDEAVTADAAVAAEDGPAVPDHGTFGTDRALEVTRFGACMRETRGDREACDDLHPSPAEPPARGGGGEALGRGTAASRPGDGPSAAAVAGQSDEEAPEPATAGLDQAQERSEAAQQDPARRGATAASGGQERAAEASAGRSAGRSP